MSALDARRRRDACATKLNHEVSRGRRSRLTLIIRGLGGEFGGGRGPSAPGPPPKIIISSPHPINSLIRSRWFLSLVSFSVQAWSFSFSFGTTSAGALAEEVFIAQFALGCRQVFSQFLDFLG